MKNLDVEINIDGQELKKKLNIKDGEDGKDGKQGLKGERGLRGLQGIKGKDGKDGIDGQDGSPDTGEEIVDKINDLPEGGRKIDASHIKNLKESIMFMGGGSGGGSSVDLSGYVPYTGATDNVNLGTNNLTTGGISLLDENEVESLIIDADSEETQVNIEGQNNYKINIEAGSVIIKGKDNEDPSLQDGASLIISGAGEGPGGISFNAGNAENTALSGATSVMRAGSGGTLGGDGGSFEMYGGDATSGAGGAMYLNGGDTALGNGGNIELTAGNTNSGTGGNIVLTAGKTEEGSPGSIQIYSQDNTATMLSISTNYESTIFESPDESGYSIDFISDNELRMEGNSIRIQTNDADEYGGAYFEIDEPDGDGSSMGFIAGSVGNANGRGGGGSFTGGSGGNYGGDGGAFYFSAGSSYTGTGGNIEFRAGASQNAGAVLGVEIDSAGSGYQIDDVLTIEGSFNPATLLVTSVGGSGELDAVSVLTGGSGYTDAQIYSLSGGSGANGTVVVSSPIYDNGEIIFNHPISSAYGEVLRIRDTPLDNNFYTSATTTIYTTPQDGGNPRELLFKGCDAPEAGDGTDGGSIYFEGGNGYGSGNSGGVTFKAGTAGDTGNGNYVNMYGGNGGATSGDGGGFQLYGGDAGADGGGGSVILQGGEGSTQDGGDITLIGGYAPDAGAVLSFELTDGGNGYQMYDNVLIDGGDSNANLYVTNVGDSLNSIDVTSIDEDGSGYQVNDELTLDGGNSDAVITVTEVDTGGEILDYTITAHGSGYSADTTYDLTGGNGGSATLYVESLLEGYPITELGFDSYPAGSGYSENEYETTTSGSGSGCVVTVTSVTAEVYSGKVKIRKNSQTESSAILNVDELTESHTYTFPDADGTFLLAGNELYLYPENLIVGNIYSAQGDTDTSGNDIWINGGAGGELDEETGTDGGNLYLAGGEPDGDGTGGQVILSDSNSGYYATLDTTSLSDDRTYTFPDATGTLALTSDLDSYVPYTGATTDLDIGENDIKITSDSNSIILGAGDDMSIGYDGTDGNIDTSLVAPSDLQITCGANKTLELQNEVYEDIRITPGSFDRPGSSDPSYVSVQPGGSGTATYLTEWAKNNLASFTVQIPHSYKTGEDIKVHVHWTPGDRGNEESGATVGWKIDYTWANINSNFGTMSTADCSDACDGTDWKHQMSPDITIDGHTVAKGISSMLICNIKRTDTGTDDTWAGTASGQLPLLLEVDFHFPIDTMGSRDWGSK